MYLISVYFDETSEKRMKGYMKQIGKITENTMMLDGNVPPHITISAFHAEMEAIAHKIFESGARVNRIGLAKTNPYTDLAIVDLKNI